MAQKVGRGIALLFHDRGTRRWWVVSSTPRPHFTPGKDPVPILQEAGWAPGPVWTGGKSCPHRDSIPAHPGRSQSLYLLSYSAYLYIYMTFKKQTVRQPCRKTESDFYLFHSSEFIIVNLYRRLFWWFFWLKEELFLCAPLLCRPISLPHLPVHVYRCISLLCSKIMLKHNITKVE